MIHLRRGGILAAFPAGTIAVPDDLHAPSIEQPWKAAVFALAIRCQTPVVCLHIKQQHRPLVVRLLRTHAWVRTLAMGWLFLLMRKKIFGVVVKQTIAVDGAGEAMDLCHSAHRAIDER
jgi:putative hemolysin